MAQLLSPVCTDSLKFQNPRWDFCSRNQWPLMGKRSSINWGSMGHGARTKMCKRARVATGEPSLAEDFADDYYAVLGLLPDATPEQIKKAYYNCMKSCHPDLSGNNPETTNFCMFINDVYSVLSDPVQRLVYDQIHGYALTAINPFFDDSTSKDHVFVDEFSCIGCKNCTNVCGDVFTIEEDFGRARAYCQSGSTDSVQQAIDSCPVDCIYWTSAQQLSLLEDEMRRIERVNVAFMLSGMGSASVDVFRMARSRWEKRQSKILADQNKEVKCSARWIQLFVCSNEQARMRMMYQKESGEEEIIWNNLWGKHGEQTSTEEEVNERARRAAAAARRWREYSRRGVDKYKPAATMKLPEAVSDSEN